MDALMTHLSRSAPPAGGASEKMLETKSYSMHSKFKELMEDLLGRRVESSDRQGTPMGFQGRLLKLGPAPNLCFLYVTGQKNCA